MYPKQKQPYVTICVPYPRYIWKRPHMPQWNNFASFGTCSINRPTSGVAVDLVGWSGASAQFSSWEVIFVYYYCCAILLCFYHRPTWLFEVPSNIYVATIVPYYRYYYRPIFLLAQRSYIIVVTATVPHCCWYHTVPHFNNFLLLQRSHIIVGSSITV